MNSEDKKKSISVQDFREQVQKINQSIGKKILSKEETLLLAAESLSRTYTYEEKGYE